MVLVSFKHLGMVLVSFKYLGMVLASVKYLGMVLASVKYLGMVLASVKYLGMVLVSFKWTYIVVPVCACCVRTPWGGSCHFQVDTLMYHSIYLHLDIILRDLLSAWIQLRMRLILFAGHFL